MLRPTAVKVKAVPDYRLLVVFDNGEEKIFDVKPYIRGEWYSELKDVDYFKTVNVDGFTVAWKNGQDICPDDLYYSSVAVQGETAPLPDEISAIKAYRNGDPEYQPAYSQGEEEPRKDPLNILNNIKNKPTPGAKEF